MIVFTRNTTEAINLVAASWGRTFLKEGDEIILTEMEHHANIVPWQLLRESTGIVIKVAPVDDAGNFLLDEYAALLGPRTQLVAVTHMSNALGTITPVAEIVRLAHENGALVLIDGSQAAPHMRIDVQALDADFYVFTGHKLYGPTGIGVLYGARRAAGEDAALPGRRRHDRRASASPKPPSRNRRTASRPVRRRSSRRSASAPRSTMSMTSVSSNRGAARAGPAGLCDGAAGGDPRPDASSARRARRRRSSPSRSTVRTRTTSAPCSTMPASRCAPAITAPSR